MEDLNIRETMVAPQFGDIITNGWASENNPTRVGYFVREGRRTGRLNPGPYFEVTDGNGKFWELPLDRDHKITVRPAALLSSAEAREEAERKIKAAKADADLCADQWAKEIEHGNALRLTLQAAETRAQQAEARVEELTAALHGMRQAFGDPLTRRALGGHNERQQLAMTAARQAIQQGEGNG